MNTLTEETKRWLAECKQADAELEKQPLVFEDIDEYCLDNEHLRRKKCAKEAIHNEARHKRKMQYCREYRKKNLEKCKEGQRDWYRRHKEEISKRRKAARLLQKSNGTNKNI